MFLQKSIIHILRPGNNFLFRLSSSVNKPHDAPTISYDKVINNITVTGKVLQSYGNVDDSQLRFYIKSICPGNYFKTHKIFVMKGNTLFDMMKANLKPDQKVYIGGKLTTSWFQTADGKHKSKSAIWPTDVRILSDADAAKYSVDENSVELSGTISTDCFGEKFRSFILATPKGRESNTTNPNSLCYNRIFVYDSSLFPLLENLQMERDTFLVRGEISYRKDKDEFGRTTSSASIGATDIRRL